jgi:hypothetical protein
MEQETDCGIEPHRAGYASGLNPGVAGTVQISACFGYATFRSAALVPLAT